MEVFDLYDKDMNMLPHKMNRGSKNNKGEYHLVVHVWIRHSDGTYLMQQRSKTTDRFPFQWASCGGAVTTGEDSLYTAQREFEEEMGILIPLERFVKKNRFFVENSYSNYIIDLYVVEQDVNISELVLDPFEVKRVAYFTLNEIKSMIQKHQMWDYEETKATKNYFKSL